jgi:dihydroorotase
MDHEVDMSIEGRILMPGGLTDGVVGITDGRIVAVKKVLEGNKHYQMPWCIVVPAAVDMHVHFRQPGGQQKATFSTESKAAAFGGITTVADMPNTQPPVVDLRSWKEKFDSIDGTSWIDYALYMGISGKEDPVGLGMATGLFKLYIASTTGDLLVREQEAWINALAAALEGGGRVVVHAEDQEAIDQAKPKGEWLDHHNDARPAMGEATAVHRVANVATSTQVAEHCHIAHISCKEALFALGDAAVSSEVTPHHLFLDKRRGDLGALGKVNPPLRTDSDRATLWLGLTEGRIPIMASDHAPHTREEKAQKFEDAPSGLPGVETMMPLAMTQVKNGQLTLNRLVDATSVLPADFLGLEPRGLEVGMEAHIAVYDPKDVRKIKADELHHKCGWTPYEGMEAIFPKLVVSTSGVLLDDGEFQQSEPSGRYVGKVLEDLKDLDQL